MKFPILVEFKGLRAKIYGKGTQGRYYRLVHLLPGHKREQRYFKLLKDARAAAIDTLKRFHKTGQLPVRDSEVIELREIKQRLAASDLKLSSLIDDALAAHKACPGVDLVGAARAWAMSNSSLRDIAFSDAASEFLLEKRDKVGKRYLEERPGYQVVKDQLKVGRYGLPVHSASITPDRAAGQLTGAAIHLRANTMDSYIATREDSDPDGPQLSLDASDSGMKISFRTQGTERAKVTSSGLENVSDRNLKQGFAEANYEQVLRAVEGMPVQYWSYKDDESQTRHLGPVAQDFQSAFAVGQSDRSIAAIDADGVSLAAIKGLSRRLQERDAEVTDLKARLAALEALVQALQARQGANE